MITNALNDKTLAEYYMGHTNKNDMHLNYLHLGSIGDSYIEANGQKVINAIDNYCNDLFNKVIHKENGVEDRIEYMSTLQEPVLKEIIYNEIAHNKKRKYLIWTIPDPEIIEDISDDEIYDDENVEENFMEKMNSIV
jgi:hypothetical protein